MLAEDARTLLRISPVRATDASEDTTYLAVSDLHRVFSLMRKGTKKVAFPLAAPKILFYLSNLDRIPRSDVMDGLTRYMDRLKAEEEEDDGLKSAAGSRLALRPDARKGGGSDLPKIVEL